ncbi:MAG: hypothetical protein HY094_07285 [Candidatus Melainabacteria bacterium]|nr:hypothetical protein [Candidatus Melainabacteria bacterium]
MINLNTVNRICIIAAESKLPRGISVAEKIIANEKARTKQFLVIPTNNYRVNENDSTRQLMEKLRPLVGDIEDQYRYAIETELRNASVEGVPAEHKIDPRLLFLIDSSDKTGVALARLFQGPWGGFPFAKHTLAVDLPAHDKPNILLK